MVSYYSPATMFGRVGPGHHHHAHHTSPTQNPYFSSAYSAATYHHPAAHHPHHHHQTPASAPGSVTSSQFSPPMPTDYNCNHQYHHQFSNMTPDSLAAAAAGGWHQPNVMYSACAARGMVGPGYEDWTHAHAHPPPPPPQSYYHHQQPSPPSSTPSPSPTHGGGNTSPNLYNTTSGSVGFKTEFSPSTYKAEFGPCSGGNPQENGSQEIQSQQGGGNGPNAVVSSGGPTAVPTGTSHSPDSGMAVSDGVSSSGSPATGQHCHSGHHNHNHHHHHLSSTSMLTPSMLGSQHANLNQQSLLQHSSSSGSSTVNSGISSNGRPAQARSPFEWMKKPSYSSVTSNSGGKTRTKDKYRVVYSDTQRLELEKEFHYSRYITIRRKSELASILGLSERQVKIWFQNRRAKERKVVRKREEMIHREKIATMVHMQNAAVVVANGGMSNGPGMCNQSNVGSMM